MRQLSFLAFLWAASAQSAAAQQFDPAAWRAQTAQWLQVASADHLSPVGMYMAADWVVKAVMLSLVFASVVTWAIFAARMLDIAWSRSRLTRAYRSLDQRASLSSHKGRTEKGVLNHMIAAALREVDRTGTKPALAPGIKDRVASELARIEAGAARRKGKAVGILANIGSTAPFVGLFGTVWGIMNSFISISESNTTNLAVVAPGIAEALLATAIGLVAAIPAVIFYNLVTRAITGYRLMLTDSAALVERTLSRDLDLGKLETNRPDLKLAATAE
ncbi:tonB-system energizer ExbB [Thalassovita sp.]|jgi:biopolymer transport protein ExbB|uniref:tonB-system energizer ExbB n=1 Tax=Thalassovita sp. TaxID=1979401 RepID=UPI003B58D566